MRSYPTIFTIWPYLILLCAGLIGCGGGGGGSSPDSAGSIGLSLSRSRIDSGEVVTVVVTISQLNSLGGIVKLRFPTGLQYVSGTSFLRVSRSGETVLLDTGPARNRTRDESVFLAYFVDEEDLGDDGRAQLELLLKGNGEVEDGTVVVDIDINDPDIDDDSEFRARDPEITAEASAASEVVDD